MDEAKRTYRPYGHLQWLPQPLRMLLLGEAPVFHLLREIERWEQLPAEVQAAVRAGCAGEIANRQKTLGDTKGFAASILGVVAFLSAEVIFAFTVKPKETALTLADILAVVHGIAIILLIRSIIPPPHVLYTKYVHPFEWVKGESGQRWTKNEDELFIAKDIDRLLGLNALAQFTRRCQVIAGLGATIGQIMFVTFLFAHFD